MASRVTSRSRNLEVGLEAEAGPPEANAHFFQSGGILEMLELLLDKFLDTRTTIEKEEFRKQPAFNVMVIVLGGGFTQNELDLVVSFALKALLGEE